MSYLIIALLLSFIVGIAAMLLLVMFNAPADNAYNVVWGSIAFWVIVAAMAFLTTGWSSAVASIAGGALMLIGGGNIGAVTFTWGRALIRFANSAPVGPLSKPLRFIGVQLQNSQVPLNNLFRRK